MDETADMDEFIAQLMLVVNRNRLAMLIVLASKELSVSEVQRRLDLPQPLVSFHLAALARVGLVHRRPRGQRVYYSLNRERCAGLLDRLHALLLPAPTSPEDDADG